MSVISDLQTTSELALLPVETLRALSARMDWIGKARPDQLAPDDYFIWLLLAGRGAGKTRAGAEDIWFDAWVNPQRIAVVGPTSSDVRKTCFEGESGLLNVIPEGLIDQYNRGASGELWLKPAPGQTEGSYFVGYSAEEPERLRGPQHHRAWCDELAAWRYLDDTWDMLLFGLRLGDNPRITVTTTPRPIKLIRDLLKDPDTAISRATMYDNKANLPERILKKLREKFEGTRLGRQEIYGEILDDNPFALWNLDQISKLRVRQHPDLKRVVVAVDPPATANEKSDECGIVGVGVDHGPRGREEAYVLADASAQGLSAEGWALEVAKLYRTLDADAVVAEVNNGGDMVRAVINNVDNTIPVISVHATRGKVVRADPVSMLYEQGRVHHVGVFGKLEDQMCDFSSDFDKKKMGYSPDRVDALVWGVTELVVTEPGKRKKARAIPV